MKVSKKNWIRTWAPKVFGGGEMGLPKHPHLCTASCNILSTAIFFNLHYKKRRKNKSAIRHPTFLGTGRCDCPLSPLLHLCTVSCNILSTAILFNLHYKKWQIKINPQLGTQRFWGRGGASLHTRLINGGVTALQKC